MVSAIAGAIRMHGQDWADWMTDQAKSGRTMWAYFNNDYGADAVQDALTLRSMVRQAIR